ncbi:MAG: hypothetical protein WCG85_19620 [Polyangia bacterium]
MSQTRTKTKARTKPAQRQRAQAAPAGKDARQGAKAPQKLAAQAEQLRRERNIAAYRKKNPERTLANVLKEERHRQRGISFDEPLPALAVREAPTPKAPTKRRGKARKDDRARALAVLTRAGITDPEKNADAQDLVDCYRNVEEAHAYHKAAGRIPREKAGRPYSLKVRMTIDCAFREGWPWQVAVALVFLFAADGRSYADIEKTFCDHLDKWAQWKEAAQRSKSHA